IEAVAGDLLSGTGRSSKTTSSTPRRTKDLFTPYSDMELTTQGDESALKMSKYEKLLVSCLRRAVRFRANIIGREREEQSNRIYLACILESDLPPAGGFETLKYKRNLPYRGPSGLVLLLGTMAFCGFGFYRYGQGANERSLYTHITPQHYVLRTPLTEALLYSFLNQQLRRPAPFVSRMTPATGADLIYWLRCVDHRGYFTLSVPSRRVVLLRYREVTSSYQPPYHAICLSSLPVVEGKIASWMGSGQAPSARARTPRRTPDVTPAQSHSTLGLLP
ncbi:10392_t:CDS:2, partial [Acaulospora colombiana]